MTIASTAERLHGLDALRGFALLLGVALHATMSFLPDSALFWVTSDSDASRVLAGGFHWIHSFRLTLFFILAGFFGSFALHHLGFEGFVRDRAKRIVLPLVSLWWPVLMAIIAVVVWNAWLKNGGVMPDTPPQAPLSVHNFPLTHLWFLYALTLLYIAMLIAKTVLGGVDHGGHIQRSLDRLARNVGGPFAALVLAVPATLALVTLPTWWHWFGIPTPDKTLIPNLAACVAYGVAFLAGWALQRQSELLFALPRRWPLNLAIAGIASATCFALLGGTTSPTTPAEVGPSTWAYAFAYATASWAWSLALLGLALRFLGDFSPLRRTLADASYWIYIVHLPLVMAAQVIASRTHAPWWIEYPLVLGAVFALALGSYLLFVRHTWIGAWLNGKRAPRPSTAALRQNPDVPLLERP